MILFHSDPRRSLALAFRLVPTALVAIGGVASDASSQCAASEISCCTPHAGAGCGDASCCDLVCSGDPYCCTTQWDEYCSMAAQAMCDQCPAPPVAVMAFGTSTSLPGGIAISASDLAGFDTASGTWHAFFRGGSVGVGGMTISAASMLPDGDLLFAFASDGAISGLAGGPSGTAFTRHDILRFTPSSLGEQTSGTWSFHFDGSDAGLADSDEEIQALAVLPDGSLVIGTKNGGSVSGIQVSRPKQKEKGEECSNCSDKKPESDHKTEPLTPK